MTRWIHVSLCDSAEARYNRKTKAYHFCLLKWQQHLFRKRSLPWVASNYVDACLPHLGRHGNCMEMSLKYPFFCNEILDKKSVEADHRRLCPNDVAAWNGRFQKSGKPVKPWKDCSKPLACSCSTTMPSRFGTRASQHLPSFCVAGIYGHTSRLPASWKWAARCWEATASLHQVHSQQWFWQRHDLPNWTQRRWQKWRTKSNSPRCLNSAVAP